MTIIFLGIAWLAGIWVASLSNISPWIWLVSGLVCLGTAVVLRRRKPLGLLIGMAGLLFLGAWRNETATITIDAGHVAHYNGQEVVLTGLVDDEPQVHDRVITLRMRSESIAVEGQTPKPVEGKLQVIVPRFPLIPYGTRLQLNGFLEAPDEDLEFDYRTYLARQGIYSQMAWPEIEVLAEGQGNPLYHAIYAVKDRAQQTIHRILPDPQSALLSGILLGNDNEIPADLQEQFRRTGLTHIIAISGFNIAILAVILLRGSRPFVGRRYTTWVALGGVAIYTVLVGAEASVVRAAIMAAIFLFATRFMGRPTFAPAGLFVAAILMTLANPNILWDVGFQLSFAATLGLMIYIDPWKRWVETSAQRHISPALVKRFVRFFADIFIATLAAMLLTMPLVIYHFHQLSIVSPLANFLVLPAQPGVMSWGILATIAGMVYLPAGKVLAWAAWPFLTYTISRVKLFANLPASSIPLSITLEGLVAIYVLIFGLTWLGWKGRDGRAEMFGNIRGDVVRRAALTLSAMAAVIGVSWAMGQPDGNLHVSFLDVGQGDATFIQTPSGRQILIDGGARPSMLSEHLGREIPFWDRSLDLVIATHPDDDHVAALPGVLDRYDVGQLITNGQHAQEVSTMALLDAATEHTVSIHQAQAGEVIIIEDGVRLEVLNPSANISSRGSQHDNDLSVVIRLVYGDFSVLLTGDAGEEAEQLMARSGLPLRSIIYKAAHHGARSSNSLPFLEEVHPEFVIISTGQGNQYGHPHQEVLDRAAQIGAAVLRTDERGSIEVITDGEGLWWETGF